MSLTPITRKLKRSDIKAGIHAVMISNMQYLKNAAGEVIKDDGFPTIIVEFQKSPAEIHEKHYLIDKGRRQKFFDNMLRIAQVDTSNGPPKRADIIGKKLWIAVQEVHFVKEDQVIFDDDGDQKQPKIEYNVFKCYPFLEEGRKPMLKGDPEANDGICSEDFITYVDLSENTKQEVPPSRLSEPAGTIKKDKKPNSKADEPTFD